MYLYLRRRGCWRGSAYLTTSFPPTPALGPATSTTSTSSHDANTANPRPLSPLPPLPPLYHAKCTTRTNPTTPTTYSTPALTRTISSAALLLPRSPPHRPSTTPLTLTRKQLLPNTKFHLHQLHHHLHSFPPSTTLNLTRRFSPSTLRNTRKSAANWHVVATRSNPSPRRHHRFPITPFYKHHNAMSTTVTRSNSSTMTVQLPTASQSLLQPLMHSLKLSDPPKITAEHVENIEDSSNVAGSNDPPKDTETDEEWFVGSIDQGTTSSRFLIFNSHGEPVASHQIEFENKYPRSGWHEHDPLELVSSVHDCIEEATEDFIDLGYKANQIRAIGITNQRETTVCWDKETGLPLYNAIVWPDTRTKSIVRELKGRKGADKLRDLCGMPLSTYPSSVKLMWMYRNIPEIRKAYDESRLAFGTVDTWLIYRLNGATQKNIHVTDSSNASRTMFMNIHTLQYDDELLDFFQIDQKNVSLPKIVPSSDPEAFGALVGGVLKGTRITGCVGDQSAALVGQCAFNEGEAKNTYGTGCFLLYNVGSKPVISQHGLVATVGYHIGEHATYALEGSVAVGGSGVKFLENNLGFISKSSEVEKLALSVPDNGGVVFVTAFSGLFAPYWIDDAKGTLFGITAHTQRGHIARATLEATCYQTAAILAAMHADSGKELKNLAVDGGMSESDLCMQTQADVSGIPVERPAMRETTALGAAIAAGLAVGAWNSLEELRGWRGRGKRTFTPKIEAAQRKKGVKRWEKAVQMSKGWVEEEEAEAEGSDVEEEEADKAEEVQGKKEQEAAAREAVKEAASEEDADAERKTAERADEGGGEKTTA
ncbi:Glycerol kinase [Pseudogymnoascus verrucosus]|uniref:glycerol kinase n=1 Tax=Pseudogymnoascus verrucosus TaxID=342668 RepID=A0A1B8GKW2_9PEZI|nr:Glycerol kinase [Pseudogymnoascus verrucosus]OBT96481.2 Glycerol kinase [Pseudogymnoascus verrucosus]